MIRWTNFNNQLLMSGWLYSEDLNYLQISNDLAFLTNTEKQALLDCQLWAFSFFYLLSSCNEITYNSITSHDATM